MDAPHTRTTSAWHLWLFNPFHFLAGGQAIAVFIAAIALGEVATGAGGRLLLPSSPNNAIWDRSQRTRPVRTTPSGRTTGHPDPPSPRAGSL